MRYLGGKSSAGPPIASFIAHAHPGATVHDPFCGGLGSAACFARKGLTPICSDVNLSLISLYNAIRNGWIPPWYVSEATWMAAAELPDTDPMKAFARYGSSFGGVGVGYAGPVIESGVWRNYAHESANTLLRAVPVIVRLGGRFEHANFLERVPAELSWNEVLYCDPPYAGTTGYGMAFDNELFWNLAEEWARLNPGRVYVSEYQAPKGWACVMTKVQKSTVAFDKTSKLRTEKLFGFADVGRL